MLLVRQRSYTRHSVFLCTCCGIHAMFILVLSLWIIDIHNVVSEIQNTMLPPLSGSALADAYAATRSGSLRLAAVEDALYAYMSNIGDGFIIWRVYALWSAGRERYVFLVPLMFLVCSFAISAMLTYCTAVEGANIVLGTFQNPAFCRDMQTASYAMTLATTGVATLLIAYKAWKYYRTCREIFGERSRQTRAQRIMLLLIESGVLYMLFFLVQVVESVDSVAKSINEHPSVAFGFTVFEFNTSILVGLYPTLIVVLAHSKYSVLRPESCEGSEYSGSTRGEILSAAQNGSHRIARFQHTASRAASETSSRGRTSTAMALYEMEPLPILGKEGVSGVKGAELDIPQPLQCAMGTDGV